MPRIFISYRRTDSAGYAGRLYDHLSQHLGKNALFMDIDNIPPGEDFIKVIEEGIGACDMVLVLIGSQWATAADSQGRRRLDDPNDFVRLEIATALKRNIRVIPVLVNDASMPGPNILPEDLKPLARRNAVELSNERFQYDVERLVRALVPVKRTSRRDTGVPSKTLEAQPVPDIRRPWIVGLAILAVFAVLSIWWDQAEAGYSGYSVIFILVLVPIGTMIWAILWPIRPWYATLITFVAYFVLASLYRARDDMTLILVVTNAAGVGLICWLRLHRRHQA